MTGGHYEPTSIFTQCSLDVIDDHRAVFPAVLVGNQIAEWVLLIAGVSELRRYRPVLCLSWAMANVPSRH